MKRTLCQRVLAIDLCTQGFGYVIAERAKRLLDWGVSVIPCKRDSELLGRVALLVERYRPVAIVLEEIPEGGKRRRARRNAIRIAQYGRERGIVIETASRKDIRVAFTEVGRNKYEIAVAIARE